MHIVVLTQYFPPESGAPQNRLGDLTKRLSARGHVVQVVTAMPNYPGGQVFDGWRGKLFAREQTDAAEVLRSWIYTSSKRGLARQLAGYLSFSVTAGLTAPLRLRRADVLLWESPPPFLAPVAYALARRLQAKLVMNVSDLWPQAVIELGAVRNRMLIRGAEKWEGWAYAAADLVTYQTEGIGHGVAFRCPSVPSFLFTNGVDTEIFSRQRARPIQRSELGIPDRGVVVAFVGNFSRIHAVDQIIEAAARFRGEPDRPIFLLAGDGVTRADVERRAKESALDHVVFPGPFPTHRVPDVLALADMGVVPTADVPVMDGARSSKMFELMAMEVPFVLCGRGEGARLANASGSAAIVAPEAPAELAQAIRGLVAAGSDARAAMGRRGRAYALQHFDRDVIATAMERRLQDLVDSA